MNMHLVDQSRRIDDTNKRIDATNDRIDRLYAVIVRREEHEELEIKIKGVEQDITKMKDVIQTKMAA